ncbi:hypothetical protein OSTOST_14137, partial [Ostertagia ostertagi]
MMEKNPCEDPRHKAILPPSLNCSNFTLPTTLIVGPQKTGTTALATFLSMHPNVSTNEPIPESFEELQFLVVFEEVQHCSRCIDKSATYFDNPSAAKQAFALIPNAKIVVILYDPQKSLLVHMLAHNDTTVAAAGSMEKVLDASTQQLRKVRQRCLSGGRYTHHLDRWLELYPLSNLILMVKGYAKNQP